ncbi:unnamed protein product [Caenorhabditis brenneri]
MSSSQMANTRMERTLKSAEWSKKKKALDVSYKEVWQNYRSSLQLYIQVRKYVKF